MPCRCAAAAVGIDVPPKRVQGALTSSCTAAGLPSGRAFRYQPGREAAIAMTGVGMLNLYLFQGLSGPNSRRSRIPDESRI